MAMEGPVTRSEMQAFEALMNRMFSDLEQRLTARADSEIQSLGERMKVTVGDIVESASKGFADEQSRIQNAMSEAAKNFTAEQARIDQMLDKVASNLSAVDVERVDAIAALIQTSQSKFDSIELTSQNNMGLLQGLHNDLWQRTSASIIEHRLMIDRIVAGDVRVGGRPAHFDVSGGDPNDRDANKRPRVRVPDPSGWKLDTLKKGDSDSNNWHEWRDSFELQVGSVWPGLDRVLVKIRDEPNPDKKSDSESFETLVSECKIDRTYAHPADYSYAYVFEQIVHGDLQSPGQGHSKDCRSGVCHDQVRLGSLQGAEQRTRPSRR